MFEKEKNCVENVSYLFKSGKLRIFICTCTTLGAASVTTIFISTSTSTIIQMIKRKNIENRGSL
jgi:hypothetical protein